MNREAIHILYRQNIAALDVRLQLALALVLTVIWRDFVAELQQATAWLLAKYVRGVAILPASATHLCGLRQTRAPSPA